MARERLQKLLAQAGVASRRTAEQLILGGKVRLNGRIVTELGVRADARQDRIELDGRRIVGEHPAYYLLHKPREVVTTLADPEGRPTVADSLRNIPERVFPVGRLDFHTSGALLLTNDGDMTHALLHPRKHVPKTYIAKIKGELPLPALQALREGVTLDDGHRTRPSETFIVNAERGNTWLQITITEGKNRQIHRMFEAIGFMVMRLSRPSFAGLDVEGLRPGQWRPLNQSEIAKLKRDYLNPSKKEELNRKKAARWAQAESMEQGADAGQGGDQDADADESYGDEASAAVSARVPERAAIRERPPARERARSIERSPAHDRARERPRSIERSPRIEKPTRVPADRKVRGQPHLQARQQPREQPAYTQARKHDPRDRKARDQAREQPTFTPPRKQDPRDRKPPVQPPYAQPRKQDPRDFKAREQPPRRDTRDFKAREQPPRRDTRDFKAREQPSAQPRHKDPRDRVTPRVQPPTRDRRTARVEPPARDQKLSRTQTQIRIRQHVRDQQQLRDQPPPEQEPKRTKKSSRTKPDRDSKLPDRAVLRARADKTRARLRRNR